MDKSIIIVGCFHEIVELCENIGYFIKGFIDNKVENSFMGYPILGKDENSQEILNQNSECGIIIVPDVPKFRFQLYEQYSKLTNNFVNLISNKSIISKSSKLGYGIVVQDGVNLSASTTIGNFVKVNSFANIMHDSIIGDFSTVAPNAVILGRVKIGKKCYIGSNSTILSGIIIADGVTIGAGAVVTKNVAEGLVMVGNPARKLVK